RSARPAAHVVVADHLVEGREVAGVHVRRREADAAQARRLECPDLGSLSGEAHHATLGLVRVVAPRPGAVELVAHDPRDASGPTLIGLRRVGPELWDGDVVELAIGEVRTAVATQAATAADEHPQT